MPPEPPLADPRSTERAPADKLPLTFGRVLNFSLSLLVCIILLAFGLIFIGGACVVVWPGNQADWWAAGVLVIIGCVCLGLGAAFAFRTGTS